MKHLAELSQEKRIEKIKGYNDLVKKAINNRGKRNKYLDLGTNAALDAGGLISGFPWGCSLATLLKMLLSKLKTDSSSINQLRSKLDELLYRSNPDKAHVHFLTEINRVAKLREF